MKKNITLPSLGTVILDAVILKWFKKEGEKVVKNEPIAEVETDKVTLEVVSPIDGFLLKRLFKEGEIVKVDETMAIVGSENEKIDADNTDREDTDKNNIKEESISIEKTINSNKIDKKEDSNKVRRRIPITPVAKELAEKNDIDIHNIKGSGKDGLINKEDILKYLESLEESISSDTKEERKPLSAVRKRVAENLIKSLSSTAQVTNMIEVDLTNLSMLRDFLKEKYLKKNIKITYLPFIIQAAVLSLKDFPIINSTIEGDYLILKKYINFGIAIESPQGLLVPVIHGIEKYEFDEIVEKIGETINRARENKLGLNDISNGTISISNGGVYGTLTSTPIIPPGQTALLWTGRARKIPVVNKANQIVVGNVMNLCITYDHQVIDGSDASQFLNKIKEYLEEPGILLAN